MKSENKTAHISKISKIKLSVTPRQTRLTRLWPVNEAVLENLDEAFVQLLSDEADESFRLLIRRRENLARLSG